MIGSKSKKGLNKHFVLGLDFVKLENLPEVIYIDNEEVKVNDKFVYVHEKKMEKFIVRNNADMFLA